MRQKEEGTPAHDEIRRRAISLYTFLKEFAELRAETIRSFERYDQVLWLQDVPREPECYCAAWQERRDDESEAWIEVRKPRLNAPPLPPAPLRPWLTELEWQTSESELPSLREQIVLAPSAEDEAPQRLELSQAPDIRALWERYVEREWWPWREEDRRSRAVQGVYTDLFQIYQRQQRLGEQYEVVLGIGLLTWKLPSGHIVARHLIAANASVGFDAKNGVISVGPGTNGARPVLEQDMLDPAQRPSAEELRAIEAQVSEIGDAVWDPTLVESALKAWVHSVSSDGSYTRDPNQRVQAEPAPRVSLAPALILRKRTDRSYIRAFQEIIKQLEAGADVPEGVTRFVAVADGSLPEVQPRDRDQQTEVYFPLLANDDQLRIVERLRGHRGVLVQGPPGTGKSHTIVNLVCHLLATGQRVLVTSHTARALAVLKRYIQTHAPEIAPLAVLLLGEGSDALQAMEDSVQGITHRQNHWDPAAAPGVVVALEKALADAREDEAAALRDLRAIRERETYRHVGVFGTYEGTLSEIGALLRLQAPGNDWIPDTPREEDEPPITDDEFGRLLDLSNDHDLNVFESAGWFLPSLADCQPPSAFEGCVGTEATAVAAAATLAEGMNHPDRDAFAHASSEAREHLESGLQQLLKGVDEVSRHIHKSWAERAAIEILGNHERAWRDLYEVTTGQAKSIQERARLADDTHVTGMEGREHREVRADAEELRGHLEAGGRWGVGPFRSAAVKKGMYLSHTVRLNGRPCDTQTSLQELIDWIKLQEQLTELRRRWLPNYRVRAAGVNTQAAEFFDLCEPLAIALDLNRQVQDLRPVFDSIEGLSEPAWHDVASIRSLLGCLRAIASEQRARAAKAPIAELSHRLQSLRRKLNPSPALIALANAVERRSSDDYRAAYEQLDAQQEQSNRLQHRNTLLTRLQNGCPLLAASILATRDADIWRQRARGFQVAWNWGRTRRWLGRLSDATSERQLYLRVELARTASRRKLAELASLKAWQHCFSRMTEHERQHLVAWSKAVRAIGKGTGKYAPVHRRNAREHLNECRTAIPGWVMPLYRVAETIRPGSEIFDVAIVDEASQSGPEALLLAYLAKTLIVVGDDKQISPTHVGVDREDVNQLRSRHLAELPHSDSYGLEQSFFDLAEIRYSGRIRLREHFRCMPEIIQFSNRLCYHAEPLVPLRQYGTGRLTPVVKAEYVANGYVKGQGHSLVNPPEAEAIVSYIERALADPAFDGKTFGVVSLLGDSQAKQIERALLERIGPQKMERRQLVCGDAYAFQGDERHVMLLSLVSAPDSERRIGTLTTEADRRRFNVAASRAQDQMVLFHSATLNDLSARCFRYQLLQYCSNPTVDAVPVRGLNSEDIARLAAMADRRTVRQPDPFESWFEVDVYLKLVARGYRVLPQYEVAGYRIDLVVEGMASRIAVECDGDRWHGPEQYEADAGRQRVLERCGWTFCRIRGSAFAIDPNEALEPVWNTLASLERSFRAPAPVVPRPPDTRDIAVELPRDNAREAEGLPFGETASDSNGVLLVEAPHSGDAPNDAIAGLVLDFDVPYREWPPSRLVDATEASLMEVVSGLLSIVEHEGPMTVYRACRLYVKSSGGQRVGKLYRESLHKAVRRASRDERVAIVNESESKDLDDHVVRVLGTPRVVVRPAGPRDFSEIPPSEIAAVMRELLSRTPTVEDSDLFRQVLTFYGTRRLTANIEERLRWIRRNRDVLLNE